MNNVLTTAARARIVNRQLSGPRLSRRVATLACATILAWVMACAPWNVQAAEDTGTLEQRVKAAFLYKFAGYVEWPAKSFARPETPVVIGVMGNELLAAELIHAVTGRTVNDRLVTVKRLKAGDSLAGIHVLFIGKSESARLNQLAQTAQPRSILTVTESDGALAHGSVINFVLTDGRVRFEIALDSAEKSGLKLSSRLLAVAQQVLTGMP